MAPAVCFSCVLLPSLMAQCDLHAYEHHALYRETCSFSVMESYHLPKGLFYRLCMFLPMLIFKRISLEGHPTPNAVLPSNKKEATKYNLWVKCINAARMLHPINCTYPGLMWSLCC